MRIELLFFGLRQVFREIGHSKLYGQINSGRDPYEASNLYHIKILFT